MKILQQNVNEWLRQEAHVVAGHSFEMGDCSCLPVAPESFSNEEAPVGFLVTHGSDMTFVDAQTSYGKKIMAAWEKNHLLELEEQEDSLPAECWYG